VSRATPPAGRASTPTRRRRRPHGLRHPSVASKNKTPASAPSQGSAPAPPPPSLGVRCQASRRRNGTVTTGQFVHEQESRPCDLKRNELRQKREPCLCLCLSPRTHLDALSSSDAHASRGTGHNRAPRPPRA
jgi:hypothetical protein